MSKRALCILKFAFLCFVFFYSKPGLAQVTTATVSGTVRDDSGAVLPGVSVTLKNPATGLARTVIPVTTGAIPLPTSP